MKETRRRGGKARGQRREAGEDKKKQRSKAEWSGDGSGVVREILDEARERAGSFGGLVGFGWSVSEDAGRAGLGIPGLACVVGCGYYV